MNIVDIILLLVVLLAIWGGYQKGFVLGTIDLVTWLGSVLLGFFFYKYLAAVFDKYFPTLSVWSLPLAFIITIILARILLAAIFGRVLQATPSDVHRHGVNRFMGVVPGFANGLVNATVLTALLFAVPLFDGLTAKARDSVLANMLIGPVEWLNDKLAPVFDEAVSKSMNKLTVKPESKKSVELHFTVKNPKTREDLETKMLELINEERAKEGLHPLKMDNELIPVARAHSKDMFARGYFSHVTPDGKDPFDRIRAAKVRFITAGENLALAQTLKLAHNGLMNSPGHRANILHESFGRVGIGILDGGIYGLMVTQNFRN